MENEEKEKEPKKKKQIKIQIPNPFHLIIYALIIFVLLGGSIFALTKVFKTQEKVTKIGLENVGELITQTCHTTVLEDSKVNRTFFSLFDIPFTESRQIFSYDFDVDASLNFREINVLSIDDDKKEIKVQLPHSKIYKPVLLPNTFKSYLDSESLFSRINLSEHNEALVKMEEEATKTCLDNGLLENADKNAQKLISVMLTGQNEYNGYNIIYDYVNGD